METVVGMLSSLLSNHTDHPEMQSVCREWPMVVIQQLLFFTPKPSEPLPSPSRLRAERRKSVHEYTFYPCSLVDNTATSTHLGLPSVVIVSMRYHSTHWLMTQILVKNPHMCSLYLMPHLLLIKPIFSWFIHKHFFWAIQLILLLLVDISTDALLVLQCYM